jgi:hypothetical protein
MPPSPEARPDEGLRLLADQALAAVLGEPVPAAADDPATVRRLTVIVEAIEAAAPPGSVT